MDHPLQALIPKLAGHRVMVVGDVLLDEYITGKATRMSREAPVPVLEFESRRWIPGGAANPAATIAALGSHAVQVGMVGVDDAAEKLRQALTSHQISAAGIVTDESRPTTVKTRIMAQMGLRFPQQVARLDHLVRHAVDEVVQQQITAFIDTQNDQVAAVLCSDYRNGLLTPSLVDHIRQSCRSTLLTADAQGVLDKYHGFALVKCNADEARDYLGREIAGEEDFGVAAAELCAKLALTGAMAITRGGDGMTLATADGDVHHVPAPQVSDVYDTVGAGDTAIAVLTLALLAGADMSQAAALANSASGIVVRRVGNYAPKPAELRAAVHAWNGGQSGANSHRAAARPAQNAAGASCA